jgi:delta 1-pyrroline-5-carboxylate dehydrogenase
MSKFGPAPMLRRRTPPTSVLPSFHPPLFDERRLMTTSYPATQLLIANEWVDAKSGKTLDVRNPATGQVIGQVAHAGIADLDRALAAAQKGFEAWRDVPANERAAIMRRAASRAPTKVPRKLIA